MAYIPWWQRIEPPTFAERFDLGGLAGRRVGLKSGYGGQLVRPGVPGVRHGYSGESFIEEFISRTPTKTYKVEIKRKSGSINKTVDTLVEAQKIKSNFLKDSIKGNPIKSLPEGAEEWWKALSEKQKSRWKWNIKGKTLAEIWETSGGIIRPSIKDAYENQILKSKQIKKFAEKGYITLKQFTDEIGAYQGGLSRALGLRTMQSGSPSFIAKYPMLKNSIIRVSGGGGQYVYFIKKQTEKVVDSLKGHFQGEEWRGVRQGLLNEDTAKRVQYAFKNKALMENLKNWKKGDRISDDLIKKVFGPEGVGESTIMQLGRVLQGKVDVSGIEKDIKLGNKIIEALKGSAKKSGFNAWQSEAYKYARHEMDTIFKPGERTFQGYQRLLHKLFKEFGLKNFNIDEINALQTGWKSGTSPYTLFTQAIDDRVNQNQKRIFDGGSSRRQKTLKQALRSGDKKLAIETIEKHDEAIKKFYTDNPGTQGKVKLASLDLREPWEVFGEKRWGSLHPNVQKAITKSWEKVGFSLDVGKGALTQKELAETLQKKIKNKVVRNLALKSIGTMMSLSLGAVNQAFGAPIPDIPISEKIPVIGGGEIPMTAGKQITDIADLLGMVKDWEEKRKQESLTEKIESQPGSEKPAYDFAEGGRPGFDAGTLVAEDVISPSSETSLNKAKEVKKTVWQKTKNILGKNLGAAFSPTGLAGLLAWHAKGRDAKEVATDPWTYSYAPFLGVGAEGVEFITKNIKSPAIKSVIQRGLSLGVFTPAQIIKASRITTPAGWLAILGTTAAKMPEDKKSVFLKEVVGPEFGKKLKEEKEEYYTEGEHYAMGGIASLMK